MHSLTLTNDLDMESTDEEKMNVPSSTLRSFPHQLGPFGVLTSQLTTKHFTWVQCSEYESGTYQIDHRRLQQQPDCVAHFQKLLEFIALLNKSDTFDVDEYGIFGTMSPLYLVTLTGTNKKYANVPVNAKYFAWAYPAALPTAAVASQHSMQRQWLRDAHIILLLFGGYMYFDKQKNLLGINTLGPMDASLGRGQLTFHPPKSWDNRFTMTLHKHGRFQQVTLQALTQTGAKYFCWLFPMEQLINEQNEIEIFTERGGFVYLFHEPGDLSNAKAVGMDRYFEIEYFQKNANASAQSELDTVRSTKKSDAADDDDDCKHNNSTRKGPADKMDEWNPQQIGDWLSEIQLDALKSSFVTHKVNGDMLCDAGQNNKIQQLISSLTKSDLEHMVMQQLSHHIAKVKEHQNTAAYSQVVALQRTIDKLENDIEHLNDSKMCCVCWEHDRNILIKPCNHICCCDKCIVGMKVCPFCQKKIRKTERIYN